MAGISVGGLGSGLDINGLVTQLVAAEGAPAQNRLNRREVNIQTELSGLGFLKGAVADFQTALNALQELGDFTTVSASTSDSSVFTATASNEAVTGNYGLEVIQLATEQKLASASFVSKETVIGTGTMTFEFGTFDGSFSLNPDKGSKLVDLAGTDGSLESIRDSVNAADIDVSATIINDGSGFKLVFTSKDTGEENSLRVTVNDDDGNDNDQSGLSQLAFDPEAAVNNGKNMTETVAAEDAQLILDGINITSDSNTLDELIEGLTIKLRKDDVGVVNTISVNKNTGVGSSEVGSFIESYNQLNKTLRELSAYNPETKERGILFGDSTLRSILNQISQSISTPITEMDSDYNSLAAIGVETGEDGVLALDKEVFNKAIEAESDIVARLFSNFGKNTDEKISFVSAAEDTQVGDFAINISQLATQGKAEGDSSANLTITASINDQVQLTIDGQLISVVLAAKTYSSVDELAAEIQSKINGSDNLEDTDKGVVVTQSGGLLTITSNSYGSESSVVINGGNAVSGLFGTETSTEGLNVQGSIGGQSATGDGQFLTTSNGLKIKVEGALTGDRGSINYTGGIADTLDAYLDSFVGKDGVIDVREDILGDQIERVKDDRSKLFARLGRLETSLLSQFTNLDLLLTGFQQTSSFLTGALANLPGARPIRAKN